VSVRASVVDSDPECAREVAEALTAAGYQVRMYASLGKFLDALLIGRPDVLLMDMHLPGMEGREMFRALRSNSKTAKMVLIGLSGHARSKDEVTAAFKAGADEYFFKPLDLGLLVVRLKSLLRRVSAPAPEVRLRHRGITVFPNSRVCRIDGKEVRLTRLEFDLLLEFVRNPQRVLTRGGLIDALWRGETSRGMRAVDRHISALRTKLGSCGGLLETLVGIGYRLTDRAQRPSVAAVRS
jgi:DNA-binding response OmpR family regulator